MKAVAWALLSSSLGAILGWNAASFVRIAPSACGGCGLSPDCARCDPGGCPEGAYLDRETITISCVEYDGVPPPHCATCTLREYHYYVIWPPPFVEFCETVSCDSCTPLTSQPCSDGWTPG
jgi:hypothetical protein